MYHVRLWLCVPVRSQVCDWSCLNKTTGEGEDFNTRCAEVVPNCLTTFYETCSESLGIFAGQILLSP